MYWTPLHMASFNGNKEIVSLFLRYPKIDINAKNNCFEKRFIWNIFL